MPKEDKAIEPEIVEETNDLISGDRSILSPETMKFATLVAQGVGPSQAFRTVFPERAAEIKSVRHAAYLLAHNPKVKEQISLLQEATRIEIILEAPSAFERVKEIATNAKNEKVRLDANLDILDRAGLKPPQRVEQIQIGLWGSMSQEDMRNLVRRRLENQ
jgi:hypothetical protein